MPDVFVEDGSGGELGAFGILALGTDAIAFPTRDLGLLLALTFPLLSFVSNLFVRKLAVLAKVLMSSTYFVICGFYKYTLPVSSSFCLTLPPLRLKQIQSDSTRGTDYLFAA